VEVVWRLTQATHHTAPSCLVVEVSYELCRDVRGILYPFSVSVSLLVSPSISNILMVLSEEQVASRRP
jgi:hypothetical protein